MLMVKQKIIHYLINHPPQKDEDILRIKRKFAKNYQIKLATNPELLLVYRKLLKKKKIKTNKNLENLLKKRHIRTLSGVAPIAVLTKPYKCPGNCLYCPDEENMPKSYLSREPAVMRAQLCDFHPFKQVALRIKALQANGHPTDKLELIIMGGTWNYLPKKYQLWFIYNCFAAANRPKITIKQKNITPAFRPEESCLETGVPGNKIKINTDIKNMSQITWNNLEKEQKKNETARHRIVGLTLETRPDFITWPEALQMRNSGCTRVEIGVQHLNDKILKLNKRGHNVEKTIRATKILRQLGFKICYHMMLNLPGSSPGKDFEVFKKLFSEPDFQPDQIKIYPCVVTKSSQIYEWWKKNKYKPYTKKQLTNLLIKIKSIVPEYVRIIRVIRDIPEESIIAGNKVTNLRQEIKEIMAGTNKRCRCIRCREVGHQKKSKIKNQISKIKLFIKKYQAGDGKEYFLSYESNNRKILYAFLRLRLPSNCHSGVLTYVGTIESRDPIGRPDKNCDSLQDDKHKLNWLLITPIIRELHTYGQLVPVAEKQKTATQHKGLGKKLMQAAEKIARSSGFHKIAVIAGIGVREYYKKLGYQLKDSYMVKEI